MTSHLKEFERNARALMEAATEGKAKEEAQRYAEKGRWLAAWAALEPAGKPQAGRALLENERMRLFACVLDGAVYVALLDRKSGRVFAEGPYLYRLERRDGRRTICTQSLEEAKVEGEGKSEVTISGRANEASVVQRFRLDAKGPFVEEFVTLCNEGKKALEVTRLNFGLMMPVQDRRGMPADSAEGQRWVAVPFRRETLGEGEEYEDYSVSDLLTRRGWYRVVCMKDYRLPSEDFGSEGWVCANEEASLLVVKHSQEQMEYSLLGAEATEEGSYVRFGGCGVFHGDPECVAALNPGAEIRFGVTRYELVEGGWKGGYYAFRRFMSERGHGVPEGFDPPVHWNELYDNELFWLGAAKRSHEKQKEYYSLKDMEEEAAKAKELGCEALYLDPGWDTPSASQFWGEERLGKAEDFVKLIKEKYGLEVCLWVALTRWGSAETYPPEAKRVDEEGNRIELEVCTGAKGFLDTKAERVLKLCEAGVRFFMFDGTSYSGPCFDEAHGHPVPYTREAHFRACHELCRRVHAKFPKVGIEMHDMIGGGTMLRYCPAYYLHGLKGSHDEIWGFEYMWRPTEDLLRGWAKSLYYYNMAYELPLYLHIDLRTDNVNALQFWWYASTCRHLGIGGTHDQPAVREALKAAMKRYMRLKAFYARGKFYGLEECAHLHALPESKAAVLNLFNLDTEERHIAGEFDLEEVGLGQVRLRTGHYCRQISPARVRYEKRMEPRSASVVELWPC